MVIYRLKIVQLAFFMSLTLSVQSGLAAPSGQPVHGQFSTQTSTLNRLIKGRIRLNQPIKDQGGNTGKRFLRIGKREHAIAKPPSEITMLEIVKGSEPAREVLTFRSGQRLFGKTCAVIPETAFRRIDGVRHSVQRWITKPVSRRSVVSIVTEKLPFGDVRFTDYKRRIPETVLRKLDVDSVHMLAILDYVINHPDRRPDNWMIEMKGDRLFVRGIDNGVSWVLDHNLPPGWRPANDANYFAVELARSGRGRTLSPRLQRSLAKVDTEAWCMELKELGLSKEEITDSLRALARVQRDGLRAIFSHPRKTAPPELSAAGLRLFR